MDIRSDQQCIVFSDHIHLATGSRADAATAAKTAADTGADSILVFDTETSEPVELDLRGSAADVAARYAAPAVPAAPALGYADSPPAPSVAPRSPGRPKLGVVAREVTLLPRHWEWLASQPGSASVTLRKLVEQARKESAGADRRRAAQDSAYRFMTAMAGNEPGFEEATRALYAGDELRFAELTERWPSDVRDHTRSLAAAAFSAESADLASEG
jgi:uncharacterized protein